MQTALAFVALLLPLTLSPGPVNIALAAAGMSGGLQQALPFYAGLFISAVAIAVAGGMGLNELFIAEPVIYQVLRYAGIAYIVYLGVKLIRLNPDLSGSVESAYRFHDGLLLTALNPKYYVVVTVVYSQFLKPGQNTLWIVMLGLSAIVAFSQGAWLVAGASLRPLLKSTRALRIQSVTFGVLLLAVAAYMLIEDV